MDHHLPSSSLDSLAHCSVAWAFEGGNCDGNHLPMSVGWISKNFRCFPMQRFIDRGPWKQVKRLQEHHRINFKKIIKMTFCRSKRTFFWFVRSLFCCLKVVQILLQAAKTSVAGRGHGVRRTSCENASIIPSITSLMDCNSYGFNKLPCFYIHSFARGKRCFWVLASSWWLILANVVRCLNTKKQLENQHQDKSECSLRIIGTMFFRTDHFLKASDGLMMVISSVQLSCPDTKTDIKKGAYAVISWNPCNLSTYPIVY